MHTLREGARGVPNVSGGSLAGTDVVRVNVIHGPRARLHRIREVPSPSLGKSYPRPPTRRLAHSRP